MAEYEQPHVQFEGEGQRLTKECGHHCGIKQSSHTHTSEGHCKCPECHNEPNTRLRGELPEAILPLPKGGVNLGTIR